MMKTTTFCAATGALALLALPAMAQAQTPLLSATVYADPTETYLDTAESYLVLDFEDSSFSPESYAFGYFYNPSTSPTGYDMVEALSTPTTGLSYAATDYPYGEFITNFSYARQDETDTYPAAPGFWYYSISTDGENWTEPVDNQGNYIGVSDRTLSNGSYDGWSWSANGAYPGPNPVTPLATSMPEASSGWLLFAALPLLWVARRRAQQRSGDTRQG